MKYMTKSKLALLMAGTFIFCSVNAAQKSSLYLTGRVGGNTTKYQAGSEKKSKTSFVYGAAVGYNYADRDNIPVRTELEFTSLSPWKVTNNNVDYKLKTSTVMYNGYLDFINSMDFTPFLTIGGGVAILSTEINSHSDESKTTFAYNLGGGFQYILNDDLSAEFLYRYMKTGKISGNAPNYNNFMLGITYTFSSKR